MIYRGTATDSAAGESYSLETSKLPETARDGRISHAFSTLLRLASRPAVQLTIVVGFVAAVYERTLNYALHGDDYVALVDLVTKSTGRHLWDAFTFQDTDFYWRPLGHVYYNITYLLTGLDSRAFHFANVLIFLVTLVALYHFCIRFGLSSTAAIVAVLFFGVFPDSVVKLLPGSQMAHASSR